MRWPSRADASIAEIASERGAAVRGKKLTKVQIDSWEERGAIEGKQVSYPGRPAGGSDVSYPEETIDVVVALAKALDRSPGSFDTAVLVVAGQELNVGTRALVDAYCATYGELTDFLKNARQRAARLRPPSGVLAGRLNSLARKTLFELALDEEPIPEGIDDLIEVLGLPADLPTFPPDPEARDYPPFVEIVRAGLALNVLPKEAGTADRGELIWATSCLATLLHFIVSLATYVDLTGSPLPTTPDSDPATMASAQHVLRTWVAGGKVLSRLLRWAGAGSAEYMAALTAPVLLAMLRALPARARIDFQASMDRLAALLPGVLAMVSLVEAISPGLRHLASVDATERLGWANPEDQAAVRASARAWAATHPTQAALLTDPAAERRRTSPKPGGIDSCGPQAP